jgi:hypothetical protein
MKLPALLALTLTAALCGCFQDLDKTSQKTEAPLRLLTDDNPAWAYENLRLYPVVALAAWQRDNESLKNFKTLSEAMAQQGFRVMERKQFGNSEEPWYNGLTVQNKTQDTVLLFAGEVVKGGNQDRVLAHHEVIMPRSVRNIEVFCVEAGRSTYYNPKASSEEKALAAFNGYFGVASPNVRRALYGQQGQQKVWDAVDKVTEANGASSETSAYTALDHEGEAKKRRDAYLEHLLRAWEGRNDVVGVVAVCGGRVLGVDIYGHSDLFARQFKHLLHGYIAEAALAAHSGEPAKTEQVLAAYHQVVQLAHSPVSKNNFAGKFVYADRCVHLYQK